jgi:hypothetical protein
MSISAKDEYAGTAACLPCVRRQKERGQLLTEPQAAAVARLYGHQRAYGIVKVCICVVCSKYVTVQLFSGVEQACIGVLLTVTGDRTLAFRSRGGR